VRLLVRVLLVIWFSGHLLGGFAQDTTTTRSGFAIVTLVSGNIAGLIGAETLKNRTGSGLQHAVVAPSPLITSASILVRVGSITDTTTAIAISNPSAGLGGVNLVLTNSLGVVVLNATVRLGPRGHFARFLNELFANPQTRFTTPLLLTVSSEIPIAILALNFGDGDFTSIPLTSLSPPTSVPVQPLTLPPGTPSGGSGPGLPPPPAPTPTSVAVPAAPLIGGPASFAFAQIAAGGDWSTDIAIGNTSSAPQNIRIDFFSADGSSSHSLTGIVIQPRGVFFFSTDSASGAIR
jgi:hypothetical protein